MNSTSGKPTPSSERKQETGPTAPRKEPKAQKTDLQNLPPMGEEVSVETTGEFELYDPATQTNFSADKETKAPMSLFIEAKLREEKLRLK